jgi:methionine biosynthesis protein MetW
MTQPRLDIKIISELVKPGSRVLDLGCGEGDLLSYLQENNGVTGQGIEIDPNAIKKCIEKGLNVIQENIEHGLNWYPDASFDYVILNQSMQQVRNVKPLLKEAFRVGKFVIVGFPNFAHISSRIDIALFGRTPKTKSLPYSWYDTPNVHFLSIKDFLDYAKRKGFHILASRFLGEKGEIKFWPNLFAVDAIFLVEKSDKKV